MAQNLINQGLELPVMEHFYTVQGEGYFSGRAAYFIRLAGCNVGCVWCDVKESWEAADAPIYSIDKLTRFVIDSGSEYCVITGGEPCMYNLSMLCKSLRSSGIEVGIETSGCYELQGELDWFCFSPKKFKKPIHDSYVKANELKVIINHPSDFEWAEEQAKMINPTCLLYLQPEWSKQERFLPMIIDYVKANPKWNISLQTHKYMNIP